MASIPDGTKKAGQIVAQQTTAACSKAGGTTPVVLKPGVTTTTTAPLPKAATTAAFEAGLIAPSPPKAGSTTITSTTGSATPSNGSDDKNSSPPDWEALRAELAKNSPKFKVRQVDNDVDLLNFLIHNRDESNSTVYRAYMKKDPGQDKNKNNPTRPIFN